MEPMNSTADVRRDGIDVWVGTQAPRTQLDRSQGARRYPTMVRVHQQFLGGGFGTRDGRSVGRRRAHLQAVNRPVKLVLSREDDLWAGTFRPMTAQPRCRPGRERQDRRLAAPRGAVSRSATSSTSPATTRRQRTAT